MKITLGQHLQTTCVLEGKTPLHTAFNAPRTEVNPGEMLTAALGACMLTMVGFMAAKNGDAAENTTVDVTAQFDEKHSRIIGFEIVFAFPAHFTDEQKNKYARLAEKCPVHNSLREDMKYTITVK